MSTESTIASKYSGITVKAFEHIFKEYWKDVFKICHYYTQNDQTAADLTQNVFVIVWQKRNFLKDEGIIKHYLLRAAKLEALNFNRKQKTRGQKIQNFFALSNRVATIHTTEQDVLYREAEKLLQQHIAELPVQSQAVFKMSLFEGLDQETIASQLKIGRKTVEYHLYKATHFIKSKIS